MPAPLASRPLQRATSRAAIVFAGAAAACSFAELNACALYAAAVVNEDAGPNYRDAADATDDRDADRPGD